MLREGIIIGERYEIISRVGSGGMADVYKAMDHKLNRLVAVKVLKAEFRGDGSFIAKFRKEAQAAAGLAHPNIVNVYDVGEDRGLYYIVMELVEGITLKNYIDKKGKLSVKEATSIAIQVSLGLECAHNQGIVHRDVKPQNIIISVDGKVKLSDFGIAKAINSNTITANVMGSVHFSSPEQVRGGFADSKSDIYSLGITMYEMVTGRVPFDGDTTVAIAIKHLQEEIIPPSRYTPDLPYSLEQIILKCTQKNPERRYANIGLLIDDLKRSLIDPQGNFVQMTPRDTNSQTIPTAAVAAAAASKTQKVQAKTQTIAKTNTKYSDTSSYNKYDDEYDDDDDDDYDYDTKSKSSSKRKKYKDSDAVSSKLEKAITIGGFLIGAIIIIILIIVIGNMSGLFNKKSGTSAQSASTTTSSSSTASSSSDTKQVSVPDFRGKTLEEAQSMAAQYGLTISQTGTQESNIYSEGQIMAQSPEAGTLADAGSAIQVVVSSGASKTTIPTGLTGMTQADAEAALSNVGLSASVQLQESDTEEGKVVTVSPAEGSEVAAGSTVTLYVSKGKSSSTATINVPNVIGLSEASAKAAFDAVGLSYTTVTAESDSITEGNVVSTNPSAGTAVASGTTITLTISSGSSTDDEWVYYEGFEMPQDYTGGTIRIELEQEGTTSLVYQGENPFGRYNFYTDTVYGKAGVSTGTIKMYEYNESTGEYEPLSGTITVDFKSRYS